MERREQERRARRVEVRYQPRGVEKRYRGYSANISTGGMYIDTNHLVPQGTRIRLEVGAGEAGFVIEAAVARVNKSLQTLRPSGMGVRFLEIGELLSEVMPEIRSVQPETDDKPLPPGTYRLHFADSKQFFEVYDRDLSTGGLFVPTSEPAPLNEIVTVILSVAEVETEPISFQARVVHRLDPAMPGGEGGGNLMAGMGVELSNFETTLKSIWTLVAQLKQNGG
ncbi:MAG: PilZ domain-containing protein [Acidobacteriota bacterium]